MTQEQQARAPDLADDLIRDVVHLVRMGIAGRSRDVQMHARRMARQYDGLTPTLTGELVALLRQPLASSPLRSGGGVQAASPVPLDRESRLALVAADETVLEHPPVLAEPVAAAVSRLLREHREPGLLAAAGLAPTRSVLLTGAPGVGKTMLARWIASELGLPLLTLDLAAVMSSYLGRTGNNIRSVLDHARSVRAVLLLDELDAIAKRRDDRAEVGELKRLVTVLLQELDAWPEGSLLVAATNHAELLDPAVWRRFELVLALEPPRGALAERLVRDLVGDGPAPDVVSALAAVARGVPPADVERDVRRARRAAALDGGGLDQRLLEVIRDRAAALDSAERTALAVLLASAGTLSQRRASELLGVSRDTIRARQRRACEDRTAPPAAAQEPVG